MSDRRYLLPWAWNAGHAGARLAVDGDLDAINDRTPPLAWTQQPIARFLAVCRQLITLFSCAGIRAVGGAIQGDLHAGHRGTARQGDRLRQDCRDSRDGRHHERHQGISCCDVFHSEQVRMQATRTHVRAQRVIYSPVHARYAARRGMMSTRARLQLSYCNLACRKSMATPCAGPIRNKRTSCAHSFRRLASACPG